MDEHNLCRPDKEGGQRLVYIATRYMVVHVRAELNEKLIWIMNPAVADLVAIQNRRRSSLVAMGCAENLPIFPAVACFSLYTFGFTPRKRTKKYPSYIGFHFSFSS